MAGLLGGKSVGGLLGTIGTLAQRINQSPEWQDLALNRRTGDPMAAERARMMRAEEERARREAEIREQQLQMQMDQQVKAQERQQYTQALLTAASSQNPGLLQDPAFQSQLRMKAAAYGDPAALEAGGLLSPMPTSTELPADARLYEWAKGDPSRMAFVQRGQQQQAPANVQEWQYFNSLSPQDQQRFLAMKRSGQMFDVGGVPNVLTPSGSTTPLATPEDVARNRGQQAAATAAGTEQGKAAATAQIDLPKVESSAEYMVNLLDELKAHPGKSYAVGASSVAPILPGTPAAGFMSRLEQVKGEQFLQAYQQLKGGGVITEIEGAKAEQAIARMNRAQSEAEFDTAVDDFKAAILRGVQGARAKAGGGYPKITGPSQAQGGAVRKVYNPTTGKLE